MYLRKIRERLNSSIQNCQYLRHYKIRVKFVHMKIAYVHTCNLILKNTTLVAKY